MDTQKVLEEALKIRNFLKENHDSSDNPIDTNLDPVEPFQGSQNIKFIIIGQDPTIKNADQRSKIKVTLNLDKTGSLMSYITDICNKLGIKLENVYATNIFKYFYQDPPAGTMHVLQNHLEINLKLLQKEIIYYPNRPIITLGEPVLQLLSDNPEDKVRSYWDYQEGISGLSFKKCIHNKIDRPFYPFPHQPSIRKKFYKENLNGYLKYLYSDCFDVVGSK